MDDAAAVGEFETTTNLHGDLNGLLKRKLVVCGFIYQSLNVAAGQELDDHIGLALVISQVQHGDDVRMRAEPSHGLRFPGDAFSANVIQALGFDEGECDVPVQQLVVGQVDSFLSAFP